MSFSARLDPREYQRACELFDALVDCDDQQARSKMLRRLELEDPSLRQVVLSMLSAYESGGDDPLSGIDVSLKLLAGTVSGLDDSHQQVCPEVDGYELVSQLGSGGSSDVWRAVHLASGRQVALKLLKTNHVGYAQELRFELERKILSELSHRGLPHALDSGRTSRGQPYISMELIDGVSVTRYVAERNSSLSVRVELFRSVCDVMSYAHQHGVIHRDLKPENILVEDGGSPRVVVIDLGIASANSDQGMDLTYTGQSIGTVRYMSPEQAAGKRRLVATYSDVYSLGVVLYELLAGAIPNEIQTASMSIAMGGSEFDHYAPPPPSRVVLRQGGKRARAKARSLRGNLDSIALKCLRVSPEERYASAAELREDIDRYLAGRPAKARRSTVLYELTSLTKRAKWLLTLIFVLAVTMVTTSGVIYRQSLEIIESADETRRVASRALISSSLTNDLPPFERQRLLAQVPEADRGSGWQFASTLSGQESGYANVDPKAVARCVVDEGLLRIHSDGALWLTETHLEDSAGATRARRVQESHLSVASRLILSAALHTELSKSSMGQLLAVNRHALLDDKALVVATESGLSIVTLADEAEIPYPQWRTDAPPGDVWTAPAVQSNNGPVWLSLGDGSLHQVRLGSPGHLMPIATVDESIVTIAAAGESVFAFTERGKVYLVSTHSPEPSLVHTLEREMPLHAVVSPDHTVITVRFRNGETLSYSLSDWSRLYMHHPLHAEHMDTLMGYSKPNSLWIGDPLKGAYSVVVENGSVSSGTRQAINHASAFLTSANLVTSIDWNGGIWRHGTHPRSAIVEQLRISWDTLAYLAADDLGHSFTLDVAGNLHTSFGGRVAGVTTFRPAFGQANRTLYYGTNDGQVCLLSPTAQKSLHIGSGSAVTAIDISPDERVIAAVTRSGELLVFNSDLNMLHRIFSERTRGILDLACNNDGSVVLLARDSAPLTWKPGELQPIELSDVVPASDATCIVSGPDCDWIAVGTLRGTVYFYDLSESHGHLTFEAGDSAIVDLEISPDLCAVHWISAVGRSRRFSRPTR